MLQKLCIPTEEYFNWVHTINAWKNPVPNSLLLFRKGVLKMASMGRGSFLTTSSADFMQEDIYVCEQLQKSLTSPYFEFGPSAAHGEAPIRGFQKRVLRWLKRH